MATSKKGKKVSQKQIGQLAHSYFGYEQLRPGQEAAIASLLKGQDTLAVMPTGSGKSAIYQLAAMELPGCTIVVSPLIALQQDQVETLQDQDWGSAALINSTTKEGDRQRAFRDLQNGDLEFLFLAPEQFNNPEVLEQIQAAHPSLFVVDEAHCVSEWGHDFRPDYLRLGTVIAALEHPTILALTATAAPPVRQEIVDRLQMREAQVIVQGFDRPNIWLGVKRFDDEAEKLEALQAWVRQAERPGMIYAATRKNAEKVAAALADLGFAIGFYHAGMRAAEREHTQTAFMNGAIEVIVATTAFGMGVDKANVRFVYHYDISESLDAYYQEIGRAGRDGAPATAILFYNPEDLKLRRFFASKGQVEAEQVQQIAVAVQTAVAPVEVEDLKEATDLSEAKINTALSRLEEVGLAETLPTGEVVASEEQPISLDEAVTAVVEAQEQYQQYQRSRLEMMRGYAEVKDCRRSYLLNYFGEQIPQPCGHCDNCEAGLTVASEPQSQPFAIDSRVSHKSWGEGLVMRYEGDKIVVLFDQVGYKTLGLDLVKRYRLLESVQS
uniref:ATP-dependent DNA helicase RecQ n=1 Tax=Cyanothece sp. (strain PCC 7425 / ATCC 29141) TaxID=395961 RepID=B8HKE7_CYAP4